MWCAHSTEMANTARGGTGQHASRVFRWLEINPKARKIISGRGRRRARNRLGRLRRLGFLRYAQNIIITACGIPHKLWGVALSRNQGRALCCC